MNFLNCSICNHRYKNPVTLPCGATVCKQHVTFTNELLEKCPLCSDSHPVPKNGFPPNVHAQALLLVKTNKKHKKATDIVKQIERSINTLKGMKKDPKHYTHQIVSNVRTSINVKAQKLCKSVKVQQKKMLKSLDAFENTIEYEKDIFIDTSVFDSEIETAETNLNKWNKTLSNCFLSGTLSQRLIDEAEKTYNKLCCIENDCQSKILPTGSPLFEASTETILLGELNFNRFSFDQVLSISESKSLQNLINFGKEWKLIYLASKDGFGAKNFHSKCDGINKTLTIIKANGCIFGGYAYVSWHSEKNYKDDSKAFLFSLVNKKGITCAVLPADHPYNHYAIYCHPDQGPSFGGGHDIHISDNANQNKNSYSNFPFSYKASFSPIPKNYLAGSKYFRVDEIAVYELCD